MIFGFAHLQPIKETFVPTPNYRYPFLASDPV